MKARANPMFKYQKRVILRLFLTKECYNKGEVGKQCKKNLYEYKSIAYNTVPDYYCRCHCGIFAPLTMTFRKIPYIPNDRPLSREYITTFVFSEFYLTGEIITF